MTTNTITNVETLSAKQNNNTSKLNNNSTNSLLIWARKQRGPYYDPTTRMYHVSHNSKRYFAGYTEQDAEAEDAAASTSQATTSQQKVNSNNQNNQFKPIASIHNSEIITKDIVQVGGGHMPARVPHNGRRPGKPTISKIYSTAH
ncbi:1463_t:CDS:2 [Rhizophagus irregularis]|nr:1463_t:CDS:2 [Rhizophagus irregularis]